MAKIKHAVWGFIVTTALHIAGIRGALLPLYTKAGEDVRLPCNNVVYPDCSSTTWIYHRDGSDSIEEVGHGQIEDDSKRVKRLRVKRDCSLTVRDVRAEDAGRYTCQQFLTKGGKRHGEDADVYLSVLTMTDLEPDTPLNLSCSLSSYDGPAWCNAGLAVNWVWVDKPELKLKNDPNEPYDIISECDITLAMTPRKEDNNRKLRCQLTRETGGKVEPITFLDFPISFPGAGDHPSVTPTTPGSTVSTPYMAVGGALGAALLLLCILAAILMVRKKRAQSQMPRENFALTTGNVTNATANPPNTPASSDNKDEPDDTITYVTINHSSPQQTAPKADRDDAVTYASVRPAATGGR